MAPVRALRTRSFRIESAAAARGPYGSVRHTWKRHRSPASLAPRPSPPSAPPSTQHKTYAINKKQGMIKANRVKLLFRQSLNLLMWTISYYRWEQLLCTTVYKNVQYTGSIQKKTKNLQVQINVLSNFKCFEIIENSTVDIIRT